jgi:hypothetical protein
MAVEGKSENRNWKCNYSLNSPISVCPEWPFWQVIPITTRIIGLNYKKKVILLHSEMQWTPTSLVSPTSPFVLQYPLYGPPSSAIPSPCLLAKYRCYFLSIPDVFPGAEPMVTASLTSNTIPQTLLPVAGLLARGQYPEGPATGHLGTGFSWFPCV